TADSAGPGTGATFTLTLPRRAAALDQSASDRETSLFGGVQPLRGLRVMLVEDDNDARELLAQLMTEAGASVTRASSAAEAFELLQVEPPQVLISDIGMPDEDGMSLLRRVRALPPERGGDVPAIALTAYARPEDVRAAIDAGFQLHLVKPVEVLALIDAVRAWSTPRFAAG
ncbi:MAG TPA: response regulator, partial [Kofleriaceae bacterium]